MSPDAPTAAGHRISSRAESARDLPSGFPRVAESAISIAMTPLRLLPFALLALMPFGTMLSAQAPIHTVKTRQPLVALTFDDGPHANNTPRLIELFAREKIQVTFFEIGKHVARHPELVRALAEAGHEIGNHSKTHPRLGDMTLEEVRAELIETQAAIREATGHEPKIFRAPFLNHGPQVWTVLGELGLPSIGTRLSTNDWATDVTVEQIVERSSRAEAGDIILLHTWQNKTVEALPEIIRNLRAKGLRFVTVSELLESAKNGGD